MSSEESIACFGMIMTERTGRKPPASFSASSTHGQVVLLYKAGEIVPSSLSLAWRLTTYSHRKVQWIQVSHLGIIISETFIWTSPRILSIMKEGQMNLGEAFFPSWAPPQGNNPQGTGHCLLLGYSGPRAFLHATGFPEALSQGTPARLSSSRCSQGPDPCRSRVPKEGDSTLRALALETWSEVCGKPFWAQAQLSAPIPSAAAWWFPGSGPAGSRDCRLHWLCYPEVGSDIMTETQWNEGLAHAVHTGDLIVQSFLVRECSCPQPWRWHLISAASMTQGLKKKKRNKISWKEETN